MTGCLPPHIMPPLSERPPVHAPPPVSVSKPKPQFAKLDSSKAVNKAIAQARGWPTSDAPPPPEVLAAAAAATAPQPAPPPPASATQPTAAAAAPGRSRPGGGPVKFGTRYNSFETIDENAMQMQTTIPPAPLARFDSSDPSAATSSPVVLGPVSKADPTSDAPAPASTAPPPPKPAIPTRYNSSTHLDKALGRS